MESFDAIGLISSLGFEGEDISNTYIPLDDGTDLFIGHIA